MKLLNTKKLVNKNRLYPVMIVLLIVVSAMGVFYFLIIRNDKTVSPTSNGSSQQLNDLAPATEEEKAQAEAHKKELADTPAPVAPSATNPTKVTPLISYGGQNGEKIEVIGFVPGISESDGVCKLVASRGSQTVSAQVTANRNSSTTECSMFSIARAEFPASGDWSIVVSYESPTAKGTSEPYSVSIK